MIELLRSRRSIRKYQNRPIEPEKVEIIKEALLRSPSSRSINSWEFVFVSAPEVLQQLAQCKPHGASFLSQAPLAIVVLGDESKSDVWIEDCSIASLVGHLVAHSVGLGSCWIQIRLRPNPREKTAQQFIQKLLDVPPRLQVEAILAVGYAAEDKPAHPSGSLLYEKIHTDGYGR